MSIQKALLIVDVLQLETSPGSTLSHFLAQTIFLHRQVDANLGMTLATDNSH